MKKECLVILMVLIACVVRGQDDHIADGLSSVATIAGEAQDVTPQDTATEVKAAAAVPLWKQKLYYGYNFDIYFHNDTRSNWKENGWSIRLMPEIGWRLQERVYIGVRLGGSYQNTATTYSFDLEDGNQLSHELRIHQGSWDVTPYARYRLKTLFNDKVGIWLEAHAFVGMEFPSVVKGDVSGTDYDGLKYSCTYGLQVSPVITYQFSKKRSFQIFFSILSLGYSGTTFFYHNEEEGNYHEYTNDVIIFSGKLRNLIANQFTPGLYGLKFGIQKSF